VTWRWLVLLGLVAAAIFALVFLAVWYSDNPSC
jgi:hypothetical protein